MEISYYFECFNYLEDYDPKCLTADVMSAEFTFDILFEDDYSDILSEQSQELWNDIKLLLRKSFGKIEINLSIIEMRSGSVIMTVEIKPIRNSISDIKKLLNNEEETCRLFLNDFSEDISKNCWNAYAEQIFIDGGYKFMGVKWIDDTESTTTTKPV